MRTKRIIAYLLLVISILMLVVPVMPHHHHTNGLLCMKNDLSTDCCESMSGCCTSVTTESDPAATAHEKDAAASTMPASHHHCCCNTDCAATHFNPNTPNNLNCDFKPDYLWTNILYYEPVFRLLLFPENKEREFTTFYIESLHSILANTTQGLRAPPTLLASHQVQITWA